MTASRAHLPLLDHAHLNVPVKWRGRDRLPVHHGFTSMGKHGFEPRASQHREQSELLLKSQKK
jgi:hypothetical protein